MGYCTSYGLSIMGGHYELLEQIIKNDDYIYGIDCAGETISKVKWYSHEEDMRRVSSNHPNHVFKLTGEGEEPGDLWVKYFKNGKMQECMAEITYENYDESKLR